MDGLLSAGASAAAVAGTSLLQPASSSGRVGNSGEGSFVVHYLGATMLEAGFQYTDAMMPWVVAEILRFTEDLQALLMVKGGAVVALCARTGRPLFEAHVWDYVRHMSVVSDPGGSGAVGGRFYFLVIFRTNETYLHCRLLSASSQQQVDEIMNTVRESARHAAVKPSATTPTPRLPTQLATVGEALSFEVFYLGKLRMSTRKAPASFIDDAIQQFKTHEQKRKQRLEQDTRTNSQDSSERGSADNLTNNNPTPSTGVQVTVLTCENNNSLPLSHPLQDVLSPLEPKNSGPLQPRTRNASGEVGLVKVQYHIW